MKRLDGLEAASFQYEGDRLLLEKLDHLPLLPSFVSNIADHAVQSLEYELSGGSALLVNDLSVPKLWRVYCEVCDILCLSKRPVLYVIPGGDVNAFTVGVDNPVVCITRFAVNSCSDGELRFILGHELGHVMCKHVKYLTLARRIADGIALSIESVVVVALVPLLQKWSRSAEISADRAGLIACRDFEASSAAFLKLSGFPNMHEMPDSPSEILFRQAELQRDKFGELGLTRRCWSEMKHAFTASHPRIVERFECLREWTDMGCLDELMQSTPDERRRIALDAADDCRRRELLTTLALSTSHYLRDKFGLSRRDTLAHVRRAYLYQTPLIGAAANRLLMSDLVARRISDDKLEYELQLYVRSAENRPIRVQIGIPYDDDWAFAPKGFRERFIRERTNELKVGLYQLN